MNYNTSCFGGVNNKEKQKMLSREYGVIKLDLPTTPLKIGSIHRRERDKRNYINKRFGERYL